MAAQAEKLLLLHLLHAQDTCLLLSYASSPSRNPFGKPSRGSIQVHMRVGQICLDVRLVRNTAVSLLSLNLAAGSLGQKQESILL